MSGIYNMWLRLILKDNNNFIWSPFSTTILLTCISKEGTLSLFDIFKILHD